MSIFAATSTVAITVSGYTSAQSRNSVFCHADFKKLLSDMSTFEKIIFSRFALEFDH